CEYGPVALCFWQVVVRVVYSEDILFFSMIRRPPRSTQHPTPFPYTTLFRSASFLRSPAARSAGILPRTGPGEDDRKNRSEEHTSELQSPVVISYAVFCLK